MSALAGVGALYLLVMVVNIAACVFLGLSVYNDAKSWNCNSAVMWGILCGFFTLIPSIIYLVIRSNSASMVVCPRCRNKLPKGTQFCNICQSPIMQTGMMPDETVFAYKKRAKLFLILMIVSYVLVFILFIAMVMMSLAIASQSMYY